MGGTKAHLMEKGHLMDDFIDAARQRALRAVEDPFADYLDEKQWKDSCLDLLKVMDIAKSVYLVLEHSNEALLRTAVELVTDRRYKKCLWWKDGWYADEKQRETFRGYVKAALSKAFQMAKNKPMEDDDDEEVNKKALQEEIESLKSTNERLKLALTNAQLSQQAAELQGRQKVGEAEEVSAKLRELEKTMERVREELKRERERADSMAEIVERMKDKPPSPKQAPLPDNGKVKELETQMAKKIEEMSKLQGQLIEGKVREEKISDWFNEKFSVSLLDGKGGVLDPNALNKKLQAAAAKLQDMLDAAKAVVEKPKEKVVAKVPVKKQEQPQVVKEVVVQEVIKIDPEVEKHMEELEKSNKDMEQKIKDLQDQLKGLQKDLDQERRRAEAAREEVERLKRAPPPPTPAPEPEKKKEVKEVVVTTPVSKPKEKEKEEVKAPEVVVKYQMSDQQKIELEDLRQIKVLYEELQVKSERLKVRLKKAEDIAMDLQDRNDKLLKALNTVKQQLKRIMEIAQRKGLGKQVEEIMAEAEITQTLASPEFTCFDRLYEDAMRRQAKQRELDARHFGFTPARDRSNSPQLVRGAGGIIGYKGDEKIPPGGNNFAGHGYYSSAKKEGAYPTHWSPRGSEYGYGTTAGPGGGAVYVAGPPCESCGTPYTPDSRFCRICGQRREDFREPSKSPSAGRSLSKSPSADRSLSKSPSASRGLQRERSTEREGHSEAVVEDRSPSVLGNRSHSSRKPTLISIPDSSSASASSKPVFTSIADLSSGPVSSKPTPILLPVPRAAPTSFQMHAEEPHVPLPPGGNLTSSGLLPGGSPGHFVPASVASFQDAQRRMIHSASGELPRLMRDSSSGEFPRLRLSDPAAGKGANYMPGCGIPRRVVRVGVGVMTGSHSAALLTAERRRPSSAARGSSSIDSVIGKGFLPGGGLRSSRPSTPDLSLGGPTSPGWVETNQRILMS